MEEFHNDVTNNNMPVQKINSSDEPMGSGSPEDSLVCLYKKLSDINNKIHSARPESLTELEGLTMECKHIMPQIKQNEST